MKKRTKMRGLMVFLAAMLAFSSVSVSAFAATDPIVSEESTFLEEVPEEASEMIEEDAAEEENDAAEVLTEEKEPEDLSVDEVSAAEEEAAADAEEIQSAAEEEPAAAEEEIQTAAEEEPAAAEEEIQTAAEEEPAAAEEEIQAAIEEEPAATAEEPQAAVEEEPAAAEEEIQTAAEEEPAATAEEPQAAVEEEPAAATEETQAAIEEELAAAAEEPQAAPEEEPAAAVEESQAAAEEELSAVAEDPIIPQKLEYSVLLSVTPSGAGTVSGSGSYNGDLDMVTLSATPNEGYYFYCWETADGQHIISWNQTATLRASYLQNYGTSNFRAVFRPVEIINITASTATNYKTLTPGKALPTISFNSVTPQAGSDMTYEFRWVAWTGGSWTSASGNADPSKLYSIELTASSLENTHRMFKKPDSKFSITAAGKSESWSIVSAETDSDGNSAAVFRSGYISVPIGKPTLSGKAVKEGIQLTWTKLENVERYQITRTGSDSTEQAYSVYGANTLTYLDDIDVQDKTTYTYIVRGVNGMNSGEWSASVIVKWYDPDDIEGLYLPKDIQTIGIGHHRKYVAEVVPEYAEGYSLTWHTGDPKIATVSDDGVVTGVSAGMTRLYVMTDDELFGDYCDLIVSSAYPAAPTIKNPVNVPSGVNVSWEEYEDYPGCTYSVFRSLGGGKFKLLKSGITGLSYTDTTAVNGAGYTYRVRAVAASDGWSSADSEGKTILFVGATTMNAPTCTAKGLRVTWPKVAGAAKYIIYRYHGKGTPDWKYLTQVNATEDSIQKFDNNVAFVGGDWYAYTVVAIGSDGSTPGGRPAGRAVRFREPVRTTAAASVQSCKPSGKPGIRVTFTSVAAGYTYRLYRSKYSGGSWSDYSKITDTVNSSVGQGVWIYDDTAVKGTKYCYYVRCVSKDGAVPLSSFANYIEITYK